MKIAIILALLVAPSVLALNLGNLSKEEINKLYESARESNDEEACSRLLPLVYSAHNIPIDTKNLKENKKLITPKKTESLKKQNIFLKTKSPKKSPKKLKSKNILITHENAENINSQNNNIIINTKDTNILKRKNEEIEDISPIATKKTKSIKILPFRQIRTIKDISADEIMAPEGIKIVFWDLDGTLIRQRFFISNFHPDDQDKYIDDFMQGALSDEKHVNHQNAKKFQEYINKDHRFYECVIMEDASPVLMREVHKRGALNIGLTARNVLGARQTDSMLKNLGIHFSVLSNPNLGNKKFDFTPEASLIDGIVYTSNSGPKVTFIPDIVKKISEILEIEGPITAYHVENDGEEIASFGTYDTNSVKVSENLIIRPIYYRRHDIMLSLIDQNLDHIRPELKELYEDFCKSNL